MGIIISNNVFVKSILLIKDIYKINRWLISPHSRGDCYDNVTMESWNHSVKVDDTKNEIYYNHKRLQGCP